MAVVSPAKTATLPDLPDAETPVEILILPETLAKERPDSRKMFPLAPD
jgi:hypothetical protein